MVDYDFASGEGTLRIKDLGSVVEFWVRAGYTNFYWNGLDFSINNGSNTYNYSINYPSGADWYKITAMTIANSTTLTFKLLTATGTSSLAGPTTATKYIDRGTIPDPPGAITFSSLTSTSVMASFTDPADNGGLSITNRQIAYNKSNTTSGATIVTSDRSTSITGLSPKTTYYFWARVYNSKGWSGWSSVRSIKTLAVPDAPSTPTFTMVKQAQVDVTFKDNANNGASITARQLSYNKTNSHTGETIITSDGSTTVAGLDAGNTYYFWARTYNSVGWSAWSAVGTVQLQAGAWVNYGGVWKRAVPYVRTGGVWKVSEGWAKNGGFWKQSAQ